MKSVTYEYTGEEPHSWEKHVGLTPVERVGWIGRDVLDYRNTVLTKLTNYDATGHQSHDNYVHTMGAHMLQIQLRDGTDDINPKNRGRQRKLPVNRISVAEMEANGSTSISLDLEWDTRGWSDEMVESGCDTLMDIFNKKFVDANVDMKLKATMMIGKLLHRHNAAVEYFKKLIDSILSSSLSRLLRNGTTGSALDLLYVINCVKEKFHREISNHGYVAKIFGMAILEHVLACVLIQHSFRSSRERFRLRKMMKKALEAKMTAAKADLPTATAEWENIRDMRMMRLSMINSRNIELRAEWKLMHKESRRMNVGIRGPIHVGATYTILLLEIVKFLVSQDSGGTFLLLTANRGDTVRYHGCILLSGFLSCSAGPFPALSVKILSEVARVWESIFHMMQSGCLAACLKYMKYLRTARPALLKPVPVTIPSRADFRSFGRSGSSSARQRRKRSAPQLVVNINEGVDAGTLTDRVSYRDCVELVTRLAEHAAGIFIVKQRIKSDGDQATHPRKVQNPNRWPVDYSFVLEVLDDPLSSGLAHGTSSTGSVMLYLGDRKLIAEIVMSMTEALDVAMVRSLLRCLFTLACCECIDTVIEEIVLYGARPLARLVDLLEETDEEVSILSLSLLLQLCTVEVGRDALMTANMPFLISELTKCANNYSRRPYERAILVCAALCRQEDWWAYDPLDLPVYFQENRDNVRKSVWLDLLRSIKRPEREIADELTIADFDVLPTDYSSAAELSMMADAVGARELADFICHPTDLGYFEALSWDEGIGSCIILEALSLHPGTAMSLFSSGTVYFLGRCMYSARLLLLDRALSDRGTVLLLKGVTAAAKALYNLCEVIRGNHDHEEAFVYGVRHSCVMDAACYFIATLSIKHPALDEATHAIQQQMGSSVVSFFGAYAGLLISLRGADSAELEDLLQAGTALSELIRRLEVVHGRTQLTWDMLDKLCLLLSHLTSSRAGAYAAINDWNIIASLRTHLPPPLSGLVHHQTVDDELYNDGLGMLSASFFHLCANLCQMVLGKSSALSEGFLRRALEKMAIVRPHLETDEGMVGWRKLCLSGSNPVVSRFRKEVTACLDLIAATGNYQAPIHGTANDLIFLPDYDVLGLCRELIAAKNCPRCDAALLMALRTLAVLSKDTTRLCDAFVQIDIVDLIKSQLDLVDDELMPDVALLSVIEIVENVASGLWNDYLEENIENLRQPLGKVTRVKPKFEVQVRDAQWAITKAWNSRAAKSVSRQVVLDAAPVTTPSTATPSTKTTEFKEERREEDEPLIDLSTRLEGAASTDIFTEVEATHIAVMTSPKFYHGSHRNQPIGMSSTQPLTSFTSSRMEQKTKSDTRLHTAPARSRILSKGTPQADQLVGAEINRDLFGTDGDLQYDGIHRSSALEAPPTPGSYEYCGVSSCGSLRMSDMPHKHGLQSCLSDKEKDEALLKLPVVEQGVTAVGKLSAREADLQARILKQKIGNGFTARPTPLNTDEGTNYNSLSEVMAILPKSTPSTPLRKYVEYQYTPKEKPPKKLDSLPPTPKVDVFATLQNVSDFATPKESAGAQGGVFSYGTMIMSPVGSGYKNVRQTPSPHSRVSTSNMWPSSPGAGGRIEWDDAPLDKTAQFYAQNSFGSFIMSPDNASYSKASSSRVGTRSGSRSTAKHRSRGKHPGHPCAQMMTVMQVDELPELSLTRPPMPSRNLQRAVVRTGK